MTKRSSGIIKTKFADALSKSSSNFRRLIFSAKSGIKAFKEAYLANLEADASSTHLDSPIMPIESPHIAPRRVRSKQLQEKPTSSKGDEGSASTAKLTDDDTITEGDANSTNAVFKPKKVTAVKRLDSFDKRHVDRRRRRQHRRHPNLRDEEDKKHKGRHRRRRNHHRHDFDEGSLCDEEDSVSNESGKSFDSIDSLVQNECGCDPCGVW